MVFLTKIKDFLKNFGILIGVGIVLIIAVVIAIATLGKNMATRKLIGSLTGMVQSSINYFLKKNEGLDKEKTELDKEAEALRKKIKEEEDLKTFKAVKDDEELENRFKKAGEKAGGR